MIKLTNIFIVPTTHKVHTDQTKAKRKGIDTTSFPTYMQDTYFDA